MNEPPEVASVVVPVPYTAPSPQPVAYPQATGPFIPTTPLIQKRTYSSPLSFVGATRRTIAWARRSGSGSLPMGVLAAVAAVLWLLVMYVFIVGWYVVAFVVSRFRAGSPNART